MREALCAARNEILEFHADPGFRQELTHHSSGDGPRALSHGRPGQPAAYDDQGNWCGSVVMYALLFGLPRSPWDKGVLGIFDQGGSSRAEVYRHWGQEKQKSGTGPDNARTNLLEAILAVTGEKKGARTQRAWRLMRRHMNRHWLPRADLLRRALTDPATDIYTEDDSVAERIARSLDKWWEMEFADQIKTLFPHLRKRGENAFPDNYSLCCCTGCGSNNTQRKQMLWEACDMFLAHLASCLADSNDASAHPNPRLTPHPDDTVARRIASSLGPKWLDDDLLLDQIKKLFPVLREEGARGIPDYKTLCHHADCSTRNTDRKQALWEALEKIPKHIESGGLPPTRFFCVN